MSEEAVPLPSFPHRHTTSATRPPGQSPGSLTHVGQRRVDEAEITLCDYDPERCDIEKDASVDRCLELRAAENPTWLAVSGLHNVEIVGNLLSGFGISHLLQEDVLNTFQRPKVEFFDGSVFIVLRALELADENERVRDQQLSIIVTGNAVLTLAERRPEQFAPLLKRIEDRQGRIRKRGVDYLGWAILDLVVDHYFQIINRLEQAAHGMEEQIDRDPRSIQPGDLQELRRQAEYLHRTLRPVPELVRSLRENLPEPFCKSTVPYLSDLLDHALHASESAERLMGTAHGLRDQHTAELNTRLNQTMRVLTAVATIFMPLTFVAGVYGMNFENMPELAISWFYPAVWISFVVIGGALFVYFKRRGWF